MVGQLVKTGQLEIDSKYVHWFFLCQLMQYSCVSHLWVLLSNLYVMHAAVPPRLLYIFIVLWWGMVDCLVLIVLILSNNAYLIGRYTVMFMETFNSLLISCLFVQLVRFRRS
jgi:hypothetical protein